MCLGSLCIMYFNDGTTIFIFLNCRLMYCDISVYKTRGVNNGCVYNLIVNFKYILMIQITYYIDNCQLENIF